MRYAVLFPGQGSQFVGMGEEMFSARPDLLGDRADEVLGWSLRDVCLHGDQDELTRTDRAQPALYALGYALWEAWREQAPEPPSATAGHSLGEYTALAAAGVFDFFTGLGLVAARGKAMAAAAADDESGMAALLGIDAAKAEAVAEQRRDQGGRLWVANINSPAEVVVAGGAKDIDWVVGEGRALGIRRVVPLKVAGAFHSPFMEVAAADLRLALDAVSFSAPSFPVWANATASPIGGDVAEQLTAQLTSPVRFVETLEGIAATGVAAFLHVGPGVVTAGLAKRSVPGVETHAVNHLDAVAPSVAAVRAPIQ